MSIDEMIAVLQAAKAGKQIQWKNNDGEWADTSCTKFNFRDYIFRVKPEPREFWINLYNGYTGSVHWSKHEADAAPGECKREQILAREVIE